MPSTNLRDATVCPQAVTLRPRFIGLGPTNQQEPARSWRAPARLATYVAELEAGAPPPLVAIVDRSRAHIGALLALARAEAALHAARGRLGALPRI